MSNTLDGSYDESSDGDSDSIPPLVAANDSDDDSNDRDNDDEDDGSLPPLIIDSDSDDISSLYRDSHAQSPSRENGDIGNSDANGRGRVVEEGDVGRADAIDFFDGLRSLLNDARRNIQQRNRASTTQNTNSHYCHVCESETTITHSLAPPIDTDTSSNNDAAEAPELYCVRCTSTFVEALGQGVDDFYGSSMMNIDRSNTSIEGTIGSNAAESAYRSPNLNPNPNQSTHSRRRITIARNNNNNNNNNDNSRAGERFIVRDRNGSNLTLRVVDVTNNSAITEPDTGPRGQISFASTAFGNIESIMNGLLASPGLIGSLSTIDGSSGGRFDIGIGLETILQHILHQNQDRPLPQVVLQDLPRHRIVDEDSLIRFGFSPGEMCHISLEEYAVGDVVMVLPCGHR